MQEQLFQLIKARYHNKEQLIAKLMEVLNISRSAVYKRLSGTILLNSVEISDLIKHFDIDSHLLFKQKQGSINFQFPPLFDGVENQGAFLKPIIEELHELSKNPDSKVIFLATGFPIFYFFFHREIAHFKFYIFKNSVWDKPKTKLQQFNLKDIDLDFDRLAQYEKVRKLYAMVDSEEVWSGNIFQSTIEDISSYLEAGLFANLEDALILVDKLLETLDQIDQMIETGDKTLMSGQQSSIGKLTVYHNNFGRFGTNILTQSPSGNKLYSTFDLPNYLICNNQSFIEYTQHWMEKIKKRSLPLSVSSDLVRLKFFNKIREEIKTERAVLQHLIESIHSK